MPLSDMPTALTNVLSTPSTVMLFETTASTSTATTAKPGDASNTRAYLKSIRKVPQKKLFNYKPGSSF